MTLNTVLDLAIKRLTIADVTLKRITASLADDFFPEIEDVASLSVQSAIPKLVSINTFEPNQPNRRRRYIFEMFAALRMLKPSEYYEVLSTDEVDQLQCAKIECVFLVSYDEELDEGPFNVLDKDCLSEFGNHNVPFNMWPYWREVVQSACSRMGLPKIVLPTHRLKKSATHEIHKEQATQGSRQKV